MNSHKIELYSVNLFGTAKRFKPDCQDINTTDKNFFREELSKTAFYSMLQEEIYY